MNYRCPVCGFASLPYPPTDYHICPCCSTEFGSDDADYTHEQLREMWVAGGAAWFFGQQPAHWNPWTQLILAGFTGSLPADFERIRFDSNAVKNWIDVNVTGVRYPIRGLSEYIFQTPQTDPNSGLEMVSNQSALVGA
ncbi:MAG: hypothetical protein WA542_19230 [Candidatus Acidiferrum sp.]